MKKLFLFLSLFIVALIGLVFLLGKSVMMKLLLLSLQFVVVIVTLIGSILLQGLRKIPANPPHKGVVTVWGERTVKVLDEGWHFLPLYPYWYGVIPVKVTKVDQDFKPQLVRTPDRAELTVKIGLTWTPDSETDHALINYLDVGGEEGVKNIMDDIVQERLREWAISGVEGPQNWEEAMGAHADAGAILLKAILGDDLEKINSEIPTLVLLHYFGGQGPLGLEKLAWGPKVEGGPKWEKLEEKLPTKGSEEYKKLHEEVEKRRAEIQSVRAGNGSHHKSKLGIVLNRINISEVKLEGTTAKEADDEAKEIQKRKGEVYEVKTDLQKASLLIEAAKTENQELNLKDAYQIVLEWKATREGHGFTVPGIAPAVIDLAKMLFGSKVISPVGSK